MIPAKIHWIWLSDGEIPESAKMCTDLWSKTAEGFEIKKWTMKDFDFSKMPDWVNEATERKKWAFATDYLRLYVLYNEGGFYLDSDVLMLRSPEEFRKYGFVSAIEYFPDLFDPETVDGEGRPKIKDVPGMGVQAAVMGSEPGHPFVGKCMEFYESAHFITPDGKIADTAAPQRFATVAAGFGMRFRDEYQELSEGIVLFPSSVIVPHCDFARDNAAAIHLCTGSWTDMDETDRRAIQKRNRRLIENTLIENGDYRLLLKVVPERTADYLKWTYCRIRKKIRSVFGKKG